jgi:hypothetical protein
MTTVEVFWARLKRVAREQSGTGRHPSVFQARAIVRELVRDCRVDPAPPPEAVEFYVREFLSLTEGGVLAGHC